ncbi:hypothetical protein [Reinekea sp. G2M2-21]|uniref:hypothetical protein n=1 Tax=Reinekea sp. G2M2-21 TaxID=2788942 RepID=UPI0018A92413|nr:hypothetical protein [Reinekea sp. G2M2-21]
MPLANIEAELIRFQYTNQKYLPGDCVATKLKSAENGAMYAIVNVGTGLPLAEPCNSYANAATETEVIELAYRYAHQLPTPRSVYSGKNCDGITKSSAEIWIKKNESRYSNELSLSIKPYGTGKFEVFGSPLNWGELICRGADLFHRELNQLGVALDVSEINAIKVFSIRGKQSWRLSDCDIIPPESDYF